MASEEGDPVTPLFVMARARLFNTGNGDPIQGPVLLGRKPAVRLEDPTIIQRGEIGVTSRPYLAPRHQLDKREGLSQ